MLNKRGFSYGAKYPWHFESRGNTGLTHVKEWFVFHAGTEETVNEEGLTQWDAAKLCEQKNGIRPPSAELLAEIDSTP